MLADTNLAGCRRGHVHGLINQSFRTPHLVHAHGLDHINLSFGDPLKLKRKPSRPRCQLGNRAHVVACSASSAEVEAGLANNINERLFFGCAWPAH